MKNAAIICEFDPLHTGHEHLIKSVRARGASQIVCIMSGDACQRGEISTFPKHKRAEAALSCGADLVLELPFPYSCASAEFFAYGAMSVISALGCIDTLCFGSESGDAKVLEAAADTLLSESFFCEYSRVREENKSLGAASQIEMAFSRVGGDASLLSGANNVLAIEYIKAAKRMSVPLEFCSVRRAGAGHGEEVRDGFASGTYLRDRMSRGELPLDFIPSECIGIFANSSECGDVSLGMQKIGDGVLSHFRLLSDTSDVYAECGGGLLSRMVKVSHKVSSYSEFMSALKTKKYTDARLRRAVIFAMCSVSENDLRTPAAYTTLLGASESGISLLSEVKKSVGIPIVSASSMLRSLPDTAHRQRLLSYRIAAIRSLTKRVPSGTESELVLCPKISKK